MEGLTKIETASLSLEEPSTELTLGIGSSFQSKRTVVIDVNHRAKKKTSMNPAQEQRHNAGNVIVEDLTLDEDDLSEKKRVIEVGGGSGTHHGGGEDQPILLAPSPTRLQQEIMERRRINRTISNRLSAKRSRARKNEYVAEMERQAKYLENKIAILKPQVMAYEHQRHMLLLEQHEVKYRMALLEKERLLKEIETEKMRDEIMKLLELQKHHEQIRAEEMRSWGVDMTLMCPNPNPGPSKPVLESSSSVEDMEADDDTANSHINNGRGKAARA